MARKSSHNLPPGIQLDQHGIYWATLEGEDATRWRKRYPGKSLPRRKAADLKAALKLQRGLSDDIRANRDPNANNPKVAERMGHSSISITADRYGHLYQGNNQDADALDRLLKRA